MRIHVNRDAGHGLDHRHSGRAAATGDRQIEFEVRNEGDAPLQLDVRETSCKCTTGKLHRGLLAAGESTSVTWTWNTGYQADHYEQTAVLTTNDPDRPTVELKVSGQVRAELVAPPRVQLPAADPGQLVESSFILYSQLWDDFTVLKVESELSGLQWSAEPVMLDERGAIPEAGLFDAEAKSAWRVKVWLLPEASRAYAGDLTLRIAPDNTDAAAAIGQFLCFIKGDWQRGRTLLSQHADSELQRVAELDLQNASEPSAQVAIGDAWWQLAERATSQIFQHGARDRAVHWYRRALDRLPDSLDKIHAQARVREAGESDPATPLASVRRIAKTLGIELHDSTLQRPPSP